MLIDKLAEQMIIKNQINYQYQSIIKMSISLSDLKLDIQCSTCLTPYDLGNHKPYSLQCGHTVC